MSGSGLAFAQVGRRAGAAAGGAFDQGVQVDFLHHAAAHEELVGRFVSLVQAGGHDLCNSILHQAPALAGHLGVQPLVDQGACHHVGQQDVAARQLLALFQVLDAQPQFVEIAGALVEHPHGQARGDDLVIDGAFGHQFEPAGVDRLSGSREPGQQGSLDGPAAVVQPGGLVALEAGPGVSPLLHLARGAGLIQDGGEPGVAGLDDLGKSASHVNHEELTRLFGQGRDVLVG